MQESYVNSSIASMQTSLESIQTHAEWGSTKTGKTVQSQILTDVFSLLSAHLFELSFI